MTVFITCKSDKDPIKNEGTFLGNGIFFLDAQGYLTPKGLVRSGRNSNSSESTNKNFRHMV